MNGKEYACCYCDEGFEPFEEPLFLQGHRVSHGSCHKAALYSQHVTITPTKCKLVEKQNHLAVHGLFDSLESAQKHLEKNIPDYVAKGYFMDKTLTKDSFEII
jgi:hypothetical protein